MDYGMIGKIEKARRYAEEPQRITFKSFTVEFRGSNDDYQINLRENGWHCTCPGFHAHHICPHIMAMEKLFRPMLKRDPLHYAPGQNVVSDVEKATRYAHEQDRIQFVTFEAVFQGENSEHAYGFADGKWHCDCDFFRSRGVCSHTMAMERLLAGMLNAMPQMAVH
jgi:SWIM zinc finger